MTGLLPRPLMGDPLDLPALLERLGAEEGVRANMVTSVDGHATIGGRVGDLTGDADQAMLLALRGWCDVLLVGAGTIRAEGYGVIDLPDEIRRVRQARGQSVRPVLAILSGSLELDPAVPAFADAGPDCRPWVLTLAGSDPVRRARLEPYAHLVDVAADPAGRPSPAAAVDVLRAMGMPRVLSEGGPSVLAGLVGAGALDELFCTVSPVLVCGTGPGILQGPAYEQPVALELLDVLGGGGEVFLRYEVGPVAGAGSDGAERP